MSIPPLAQIAVSNIAWEPHEDKTVAMMLARRGVTAIEVAPARLFPDPSAISSTAVKSTLAFWSDHGIRLAAMQGIAIRSFRLGIVRGHGSSRSDGSSIASDDHSRGPTRLRPFGIRLAGQPASRGDAARRGLSPRGRVLPARCRVRAGAWLRSMLRTQRIGLRLRFRAHDRRGFDPCKTGRSSGLSRAPRCW